MNGCRRIPIAAENHQTPVLVFVGNIPTKNTRLYIYNHIQYVSIIYIYVYIAKGSLGGETSVLRTFRKSEKELVKEP